MLHKVKAVNAARVNLLPAPFFTPGKRPFPTIHSVSVQFAALKLLANRMKVAETANQNTKKVLERHVVQLKADQRFAKLHPHFFKQ